MNPPLRLLVVAQEFPFPPNHGGRADVWRRLNALNQLGCSVGLVCWVENSTTALPKPLEIEAVKQVVDFLEVVPQSRGIGANVMRFIRMLSGLPSHVASRVLPTKAQNNLMAALCKFNPNAILLDCPYGGELALRVSRKFNIPLIYRSHNIEHLYFARQASSAIKFKNKVAWKIACVHLKSFERNVIKRASLFFDISIDDLAFWSKQGFTHGHWLPPLPEEALGLSNDVVGELTLDKQVGFLGNLNAPNNVKGISWLIKEVMPIVWGLKPDTVLTLAGSRPSDEVLELVKLDSRIQLIKNIPNAPAFLAKTAVLVNPVLSGSGVNVKTLDMLMTERPIVSSSQGVAGLNVEIKSLCEVADTPESFAKLIVMQLENPSVDIEARVAARRFFLIESVQSMLTRIELEVNKVQLLNNNKIESQEAV